MLSPVGNKKQMKRISLEEGLIAYECMDSGGVFLPITSYTSWLSKQPAILPKLSSGRTSRNEEADHDSMNAKICPETGCIMSRFRVGNEFSFFLDRSPSGSIWLDRSEWEKLRERQYHDELVSVFTTGWQEDIETAEKDKQQNEFYISKFGEGLFSELQEMKKTLSSHPHRSTAIAFLTK